MSFSPITRATLFLSPLLLALSLQGKPNFQLSWPTPNPAFAKGMGYSAFLQKTGPDKAFSSGAFGCVRNNGFKFHEGLDLYPVKRDGRGRADDKVFSAMEGVIRHLNPTSGYSAYGKYLVLEHTTLNPPLYSLYAHLASIEDGLKVGSSVRVAQVLGKMGNTASYRIPLDRSHLHFEIGLRLTDDFQRWYDKKPYTTKNRHGNFSGFNLVGIDPLPFYSEYQKKSFSTPLEYLRSLPVATKVRVRSTRTPDFVRRYPTLCKAPPKGTGVSAWDCSFGPFGIPVRIEPASQPMASKSAKYQVLSVDYATQQKPCRRLVVKKGSSLVPAEQLLVYLELLFGI